MNSTRKILLHLSLIDGVGPAFVHKILSNLTVDRFAELYSFSVADLVQECFLSARSAERLYNGLQDKQTLDEELKLLEKYNISLLTLIDDGYPKQLKQIHLPPTVLYVQGALFQFDECLAIVGSRKAHRYAQDVINNLVPSLVANSWTIVSGGAIGADTMAHKAALKFYGKTIAVLGSGLLQPYPGQNRRLFSQIIETGGAVVSPFPLQMEALPSSFPARNRIIAGLSRGCLVVQAAERSGASITAHFALEQGREVFAVPGPIDDSLSVGCHRLVQQGAKLVTESNDILVEFGQSIKTDSQEIVEERASKTLESKEPHSLEEKILLACKKPKSVDELIEKTGQCLDQLQSLLFDLQLQNKITQDFTGLWKS